MLVVNCNVFAPFEGLVARMDFNLQRLQNPWQNADHFHTFFDVLFGALFLTFYITKVFILALFTVVFYRDEGLALVASHDDPRSGLFGQTKFSFSLKSIDQNFFFGRAVQLHELL